MACRPGHDHACALQTPAATGKRAAQAAAVPAGKKQKGAKGAAVPAAAAAAAPAAALAAHSKKAGKEQAGGGVPPCPHAQLHRVCWCWPARLRAGWQLHPPCEVALAALLCSRPCNSKLRPAPLPCTASLRVHTNSSRPVRGHPAQMSAPCRRGRVQGVRGQPEGLHHAAWGHQAE